MMMGQPSTLEMPRTLEVPSPPRRSSTMRASTAGLTARSGGPGRCRGPARARPGLRPCHVSALRLLCTTSLPEICLPPNNGLPQRAAATTGQAWWETWVGEGAAHHRKGGVRSQQRRERELRRPAWRCPAPGSGPRLRGRQAGSAALAPLPAGQPPRLPAGAHFWPAWGPRHLRASQPGEPPRAGAGGLPARMERRGPHRAARRAGSRRGRWSSWSPASCCSFDGAGRLSAPAALCACRASG